VITTNAFGLGETPGSVGDDTAVTIDLRTTTPSPLDLEGRRIRVEGLKALVGTGRYRIPAADVTEAILDMTGIRSIHERAA